MAMKCSSCGAKLLDGASFCERCGLQVGIPQFKSHQFLPQPTKDNKVLWIIVTVVIVAVVVPVVLAAVLYFMVLGFNPEGESTPSLQIIARTSLANPNGYKFAMTGPTQTVTWTDLTVILQSGASSTTWDNALRISLTGSGAMTQQLGDKTLGTSTFNVAVTDLGGNGAIDNGDYFAIYGPFVGGTSYTVILLYEPTNGKMVDTSWTA